MPTSLNQDREQTSRRRDIPGWAQVFGTVFAVVVPPVSAATWAGAATGILAALAALAICAAIVVGLNQRQWSRGKRALVGVCGGFGAMLTLAAVFAAALARSPTPVTAQGAAGGEPTPIVSSSDYRLTPSSSIFTNDQDKVDLDTGCPGHGPTKPQLGPARCGENADLILDAGELLTWERQPRAALLPRDQPASFGTCRQLASAGSLAGGVEIDRLNVGSELCVVTDKGNIAAVRVESIADLPAMTLSFDVWPRG